MRNYLLQTKNTRHLLTPKPIIHIFLYSRPRIINPFCSSQLRLSLLRFQRLKKGRKSCRGGCVSLPAALFSNSGCGRWNRRSQIRYVTMMRSCSYLLQKYADPIFVAASRYSLPLLHASLASLWPLQVRET